MVHGCVDSADLVACIELLRLLNHRSRAATFYCGGIVKPSALQQSHPASRGAFVVSVALADAAWSTLQMVSVAAPGPPLCEDLRASHGGRWSIMLLHRSVDWHGQWQIRNIARRESRKTAVTAPSHECKHVAQHSFAVFCLDRVSAPSTKVESVCRKDQNYRREQQTERWLWLCWCQAARRA